MYLIGQNLTITTSKWLKNSLNLGCLLFFFILTTSGCQSLFGKVEPAQYSAQRIELKDNWLFYPSNSAASNYYQEGTDFSGFKSIKVPSNWFSEGYEHSGVAWYKTSFTVNAKTPKQLYQLVFDGVDYFADVWVNGQHVGFHEGYFQSFRFDVSQYLKQGENLLVVRVNSPQENSGQSWSLHKQYIKGVLGHHDTRPGGAWSERGQEQNTGGIWQSVWLEINELHTIEQFQFTPKIHENGDSSANISVDVLSNSRNRAIVEYSLYYQDERVESYEKNISFSEGKQTLQLALPPKKRLLWSPWEHGEPHLYTVKIQIKDLQKSYAYKSQQVGFREFTVDEPNGLWRINGNNFFVRGTNYIAWQWLSEMTEERFLADLTLMKEANINAIRVHAHVLPKRFYKLADQLGMVIWQDFPLQWGYVDTPEFVNTAENQAREMVKELYNYPSIMVWSAHNEPPWDASWMKYKYPDYKLEQQQNSILDEKVLAVFQANDTSRYSHKSSLTSEHPWLGWYSGKWTDYSKPTDQRWITEFGAQALPNKDVLEKIVGKENLWPTNKKQWDIWKYHNFQPTQTFKLAKIDKGRNVEGLIKNTQQYQYKLNTLAAESYRRQKMSPVNAIFQFMFVEDWPSMNWGVVDYLRNPKPGYFALKKAYQPLLPSIEFDPINENKCCNIKFSLWMINDLVTSFSKHKMKYQLYKDNVLLSEQVFERTINASSVTKITDIQLKSAKSGHYKINWVVVNENEKVIAQNDHEWVINNG